MLELWFRTYVDLADPRSKTSLAVAASGRVPAGHVNRVSGGGRMRCEILITGGAGFIGSHLAERLLTDRS